MFQRGSPHFVLSMGLARVDSCHSVISRVNTMKDRNWLLDLITRTSEILEDTSKARWQTQMVFGIKLQLAIVFISFGLQHPRRCCQFHVSGGDVHLHDSRGKSDCSRKFQPRSWSP